MGYIHGRLVVKALHRARQTEGTNMSDDLIARLYAYRYPMQLEPHYSKHVQAMTAEKLHFKSDIAAELAYRDKEIERLQRERDEAHATMKRWQSSAGCVGTFCKADALIERAERAEAELATVKANRDWHAENYAAASKRLERAAAEVQRMTPTAEDLAAARDLLEDFMPDSKTARLLRRYVLREYK